MADPDSSALKLEQDKGQNREAKKIGILLSDVGFRIGIWGWRIEGSLEDDVLMRDEHFESAFSTGRCWDIGNFGVFGGKLKQKWGSGAAGGNGLASFWMMIPLQKSR